MSKDFLTLSQLLYNLKESIKNIFPFQYWVVAEISEMHTNYSGHCYLELIEKDEAGTQLVSKIKATIWSFKYRMIKPYFEVTTGQNLRDGLKVLVQVSVEFHELYGISLNITDIDPVYTIGEQERQRREIIERLVNDGIIDLNKQLEFPEIPKTIAVISSKTAAGFGDFMHQISNNSGGYKFHIKLFNSVMQGDQAEASIISALEKIYDHIDVFDAVVIIRGGGSQSDLSCFDSYQLASHIAQFPLPVLTGIGHERDDTITDMVAFEKLKTPTAVAQFLIEKMDVVNDQIDSLFDRFNYLADSCMKSADHKLNSSGQKLAYLTMNILKNRKEKLFDIVDEVRDSIDRISLVQNENFNSVLKQVKSKTAYVLDKDKTAIQNITLKVTLHSQNTCLKLNNLLQLYLEKSRHYDPELILRQGYTITKNTEGKTILSAKDVHDKQRIRTYFRDGIVDSEVTIQ